MHSVWAVAVNTIKQALRMKIAIAFIALLLILLPAMARVMTGDGTLKGRLQAFICYGLSLVSLLLCLMTVIVSVYSLTSDFTQKQIYTVLTKPIRRSQLLLGKLIGVVVLNAILVVLFSAVIYGIIIFIPRVARTSEAELEQAKTEFFTARASLVPPEINVTEETEQLYKKLDESQQLPPEVYESKLARKKYKKDLANIIKQNKRAAAPGNDLIWEFHNVRLLDPKQKLFIRFKYDVGSNPPDLKISSRWLIGDIRQVSSNIISPIYPFERRDLIRTFHEIEVPADAVTSDGYLGVAFLNDPRLNNTAVIFPPEDGLAVLYKATTFTDNFVRAVALIFLRLVFLATLGTLAGSFLSFPVAMLVCLVVFFTAHISTFCLESFEFLSEGLSQIYNYTLRIVILAFPQFDKFNPTTFLVPGRVITWSLLAKAGAFMVCVKSGLLLGLSLWIFTYREIAKVII